MPKSTPIKFSKTLIALSVLSISACSSVPSVSDIGSGIGNGLVTAGKATASATRKTWNTTTYLLGFSETRGEASDVQGRELDDDQLLAQNTARQELSMASDDVLNENGLSRPLLADSSQPQLSAAEPLTLGREPQPAANSSQALGSNTGTQPDRVHTVADGETLWDIAKRSTGDANNWHVIADINDLEQNAAVFPGQELTIPGELARTDSALPAADVVAQSGNAEEQLQSTGASSRLPIPDSDAVNTDAIAVELDDADLEGVTPGGDVPSVDALQATDQYAVAFELEESETLWNLAKRATGDATNWEAIAAHNEFTEKQAVTVRPGQTIYVPESLVKSTTAIAQSEPDESVQSSENVAVISAPSASDITQDATITEPSQEAINSAQAAVASAIELPDSATAEISSLPTAATEAATEIETAAITDLETAAGTAVDTGSLATDETTYSTDNALDTDADTLAAGDIAENSNIPAVIMVSGTYFPKAVYNDADFSSSLLMRVSPGTTLQVSRAMGPWYEVETEEGVGYVHQRDIQ